MTRGGPVVVVIADSLSFHGPDRAEPADEPRLYPHVAARVLGGRAELHAGLGWTARHAWRAMVGDPRLWASLRHADAVVLGVGGMDTLPSPLPTALRETIPALRPTRVRRAVRAAHAWITPRAVRRLGAAGPVALPAGETVRHLELLRLAVTTLIPGAPVVALLPSVHRAAAYGGVHAGRARHVAAMTAWADAQGVALVDPAPLVADHVLGGHGNPDGLHWGWPAHEAVGRALGAALVHRSTARSRPLPGPGGNIPSRGDVERLPTPEEAVVDETFNPADEDEPVVWEDTPDPDPVSSDVWTPPPGEETPVVADIWSPPPAEETPVVADIWTPPEDDDPVMTV